MSRKLALLTVTIAALATAGVAAAANGGFTPPTPHSPNAHRIVDAYYVIAIFTGLIFIGVETALVVFIVKYRGRGRARDVEGAQVHGHSRLEVIWTTIPVIIIAIIGGFVFFELPGISGAPSSAAGASNLRIRVDAHQFYWEFTYPNGAKSIDDVHLPVHAVAEFEVHSQDVAHSWWIPQLGGKTDAIPGIVNHVWYKPDAVGIYQGQCAEFCGVFHERMLQRATVESAADYDAFVTKGAHAQLGKAEWVGVCAKCHGMTGQGDYGPAIAQNPTLVQSAALEEIVRHGRGRMPGVGNDWTTEQMKALVTYLKQSVYKGASTSGG